MKVRLREVRQIIREEALRGIPEFVLRQATQRYVEEIRAHLKRFILSNKSETAPDQRKSFAIANDVLEQLEEEANDLLEEKLFQFTRNV